MKVVFPMPHRHTLFEFIFHSTHLEHIYLSLNEISQTFDKKDYSAYAAGHFSAINFGLTKLSADPMWPVSNALQFASESKALGYLQWLKDLHKKLMLPIAEQGDPLAVDGQNITPPDCGNYRTQPRLIGFNRRLPKPTCIPKLLHLWLSDLGRFHLQLPKTLKPSKDTISQTTTKAYQLGLQLQCIKPFIDGSGRVSRLVENFLRLRWGLPWKIISKDESLPYVQDIMNFEDSPEWQEQLKNAENKKA
jgi:hypothetical protein